jgi:predicted glycoside hydrolase/deacetylase ChbG (UPF0249 family)
VRYIISADDIGVTRGVTDHILDAFDRGLLTNVSMLANGSAVEHAANEVRRRHALTVSVHLNLVEGCPVSSATEVPLLVDEDRTFRHGFVSLWHRTARASGEERVAWKQQIQLEVRRQIDRVRELLGQDWHVRIDSHLHVHMIPLVFESVLELHDEYHFRYVRVVREPFFLAYGHAESVGNYLGPNLVKHALLRQLARIPARVLAERGIAHCDNLVGILFSGNMCTEAVRSSIKRISRSARPNAIAEFLFHPGRAAEDEEGTWPTKLEAFRRQYRSHWRDRERETLQDAAFANLFRPLERHDVSRG